MPAGTATAAQEAAGTAAAKQKAAGITAAEQEAASITAVGQVAAGTDFVEVGIVAEADHIAGVVAVASLATAAAS